jgi:hypothetical protein
VATEATRSKGGMIMTVIVKAITSGGLNRCMRRKVGSSIMEPKSGCATAMVVNPMR